MKPEPSRIAFACVRPFALVVGLLMAASAAAVADTLTELRRSQDAELVDLQKAYSRLAREHVPRTPDGLLDTGSDAYQTVLESYSQDRTKIMAKYKELDRQTRGLELEETLDTYKGRIKNTGGKKIDDPIGLPKNVQADIDLAAEDLDAAKALTEHWVGSNQGKPIEIYTLDNPRQPIHVSPEELESVQWDRVIKTVNPNTDTTLWTPQTEEIRRAKVADFDAWTTPGGLKGTGNQAMPRDKRGFVLDNEKKLVHADRPVEAVTGAHDEELKTFAKSLSKGGQATGRAAESPELYKQAQTLQEYGDPYEAGIATLGEDTPAQAAQKVEAWKTQAREEFNEIKKTGQQLGDAADTAREDLARQTREAAERQRAAGRPNAERMDETAEAIEQRRQLAASGNRDAAAENRRLMGEADESYGGRRPGADAGELGEAAEALPSGGRRQIVPDAGEAQELAADVARINPKAKVTAIDGRNPTAPEPAPNYLGAVEQGLVIGGQFFERGSRQMGEAVDENRDLNAEDALAVGEDMVPGVAGYRGMSEALEQRQVERLRRQDRIAQLEGKPERSLQESIELTRLQHEEAFNPDTAVGNVTAMATESGIGYIKEMEAGAKEAGRERPEFLKDGVPMFGRMARDAVNAVNPINQIGMPLAEGAAELSTLDERADWAGQKVEMTAFVNRKAAAADKRNRAMVAELDRVLNNEDMSNPANRERVAALLDGIAANQAELDKLVAMADKHLSEVDPKELGFLRNVARSQPSVDALRDYAKQMQGEDAPADENKGKEATAKLEEGDIGWEDAQGGFGIEHGEEAGWDDGGFEDRSSMSTKTISQIIALSDQCDYRTAYRLTRALQAADPDNEWVKANYPAISDWARREQNFLQAIADAKRAIQLSNLNATIAALRWAMTNAATLCHQDQLVQQILDQAMALANNDARQSAIERARAEARRSQLNRSTAPMPVEGSGDNAALVNWLTNLMQSINRANAGSTGTDVNTIYRNINTQRWDDAAQLRRSADPRASLPEGFKPRPGTPPPRAPAVSTGGEGQGEFSVDPNARNAPASRGPQMIGPCLLGKGGGCLFEDGWHDSSGRVFATSEEMRRANGAAP